MPKIWGISGVTPKDWGLGKPPRWPFFFCSGWFAGLQVIQISQFSRRSFAHIAFQHVVIGPAEINVPPLWVRKCLLDTVDGRNPANHLIGSLSQFLLGFIHLWRSRISSINSIITFSSVTDLAALSRVWTVYRMSWTASMLNLFFVFGGWIYWTTEWKSRITTSIQ